MIKEPFLERRHGYRPDFRLGDTVVEVKTDVRNFRNVRAALLQLAYYVAEQPDERAALVLVNSGITELALRKEWDVFERALHPGLAQRLSLAVREDSGIRPIAGAPTPELLNQMVDHIDHEARARPYRAAKSSHTISLLLLHEWFTRRGPVTTQWLMQAAGCSYPTAARALRRLEHVTKRFPDRRLQLWGFPAEEWQRVVANREEAHPTLHYADRSGQPRDAESLLRRASRLSRDDIAVGGVIAARHYFPALDLRGTPRLDLTLHSPDGLADVSFVEQLDAALERVSGKDERASLAVHVLRRQAPLFESNDDGLPWADRVTTLLDLYDARLEPQANELLDHLVTSVG